MNYLSIVYWICILGMLVSFCDYIMHIDAMYSGLKGKHGKFTEWRMKEVYKKYGIFIFLKRGTLLYGIIFLIILLNLK